MGFTRCPRSVPFSRETEQWPFAPCSLLFASAMLRCSRRYGARHSQGESLGPLRGPGWCKISSRRIRHGRPPHEASCPILIGSTRLLPVAFMLQFTVCLLDMYPYSSQRAISVYCVILRRPFVQATHGHGRTKSISALVYQPPATPSSRQHMTTTILKLKKSGTSSINKGLHLLNNVHRPSSWFLACVRRRGSGLQIRASSSP